MTSKEIRQSFIEFFKNKQHSFVRSAPVVPMDDPTLLFTNAGMNQFKDVLLGKGKRSYCRAVNSQKCIRVSGKHNDLEEVGKDTYHHTFFEMLGNWSFGDYYKEEAIQWAWELLTDIWKLPKESLFATVFREDDEAAALWKKVTDIADEHILRFDEKDNFWEMGETGPCGPCSEIHIDLGKEYCDKQEEKHQCSVNGDCGRYIELWNLVFIQYYRDESGKLNQLSATHIDTGAGFERVVAVLQNKQSNYDTDLFLPLIDKIGSLADIQYEHSTEKVAFRVISDHVRMLTFSIADGAFPSNEGRGYVMRRVLRRAARYGRKLQMHEPFIFKLVDTVIEILGDTFPEIKERRDHIKRVIHSEEEHFNRTLDRGLDIFAKIKSELHNKNKAIIPGDSVFKLYDTFGFPLDLTQILATEANLKIDMVGFEKEMQKQQERARNASKFNTGQIPVDSWITLTDNKTTNFVGYVEDAIETHIVKYSINDEGVNIILKDTPFYAESGGQVGDKGIIATDGFELEVIDTQKEDEETIHICKLPKNFSIKSDRVFAEINTMERRQTEKNHTATHLLHASLREVLGVHVQQSGSLVDPIHLRFDFTHNSKLTDKEIIEIERLINQKIQEDIPLEVDHNSFTEAKKHGAMALFGEKYGETVRTIRIKDFSFELCGGTHVKQTGQIGLFILTYESSIASGIRRIEALTGHEAIYYAQNTRQQLNKLSGLLNTNESNLVAKTQELLQNKRDIEKELAKTNAKMLTANIETIINSAEVINGVKVISQKLENSTIDQLKELGDKIRERSNNTVALFGTISNKKLGFVCIVSDDLIKTKNLNAGDLVRKIAQIAGGSGGGRPHMATAGGKDETKFDTAMDEIKKII